jgi:hypothetical protein
MKQSTFALILLLVLLIAGCSKNSSSDTDNTVGWTGTYTNGLTPHGGINRVVISKVDNNDLQVLLQYDTASYIETIATVRKAPVVNSSTFAVNENDTIAGIIDSTFNVVATGALSGNTLILSGSATNIAASADVKNFYFSGSK